jgi:hypothetical protein
MKIQSFLLAATASLALAGTANAASIITGTFAANLIGIASTPPAIGPGAVLTNVAGQVSGVGGQFSPVALLTPLTFATVTATNATPVSFTSAFGNFAGMVSNLTSVPAPNAVVSFNSLGTFTPGGTLSGFAAGPALLTVSFTQTFQQGPNAGAFSTQSPTISGSFTLSSAAVPEPASWAMLIAGFGLVGVAARRRQRTVVTA